jgi:putative ABC transport system permease protein
MRLWTRARMAIRSVLRRSQCERDLDEELRFAVDELAVRHERRGLSPASARRAARLELGHADGIKTQVRDLSPAHAFDALWRDVAYAWRSLGRAPLFSSLACFILGGGIGAAAAIFSIVNALLLAPLPYRDADRLVFVWQDLTRAGYARAPLSGPELQDLRDRSTLFSGFGGIWANTVALTDGREPEQLRVGLVTPNFFDVLGADAQLGRTFQEQDEAATAPPSILLSGALWKRRYGGDPALVGRRILVNGRPSTVVGVMPESFRLLLPADSAIPDDQQAWLLLGRDGLRGPRRQQFLRVVGRLKPGVRLEDGQKEIAAIARAVGTEFVEYGRSGATFYAVGLQADATRDVRPALLALFGAVGLLLTIGCVNVAGLLVARAAARHHETAVRLAIGASRGRVFRQCLAEGLLLSIAGGVLGMLVARVMLNLLVAARPSSLSRIDLTQIDMRVFAFAAVISILWGVLFSLAPLGQVFRTNVSSALHGGARTTVTGGYRLRAGLVVTQIAISSVLLVMAGLLAKGFVELQRAPIGFDDRGVLTFKVSVPPDRYGDLDATNAFSRQLRERLSAIPSVTLVGATSHVPYDTVPNWGTPYLPEGATDNTAAGLADARAVTPGYFEAIGAQLLEGRWFSEADAPATLPVAIVDSRMAARLWPGRSPIGQRFKADPWTTGSATVTVTVVGVVRHIRHREMTADVRQQVYFPAQQSFRNPMVYIVKASGEPEDLAASVRTIVAALDPVLPIYNVRALEDYTREARAVRAFTVVLSLVFAGSALVLSAVGLYGVTAFAVAQRRREFGLRFALGARGAQVARMVVKDGARLAIAGAVLGAIAALWGARLIRAQLYSVSPADPWAYIAAAAIVIVTALAASWYPAYRAARTSPLESLREG